MRKQGKRWKKGGRNLKELLKGGLRSIKNSRKGMILRHKMKKAKIIKSTTQCFRIPQSSKLDLKKMKRERENAKNKKLLNSRNFLDQDMLPSW